MTVKLSESGVESTQRQPDDALSVLGAKIISVYIEPGDELVTSAVVRIGWRYQGRQALDPARVLYSRRDVLRIRFAAADTLLERQELEGVTKAYAVPPGASAASVWIIAKNGTVNYQVGSQ